MHRFVEELRRLCDAVRPGLVAVAPPARVAAARRLVDGARDLETKVIAEARDSAMSWTEIGELYGISRQAAQQRFARRLPIVDPQRLAAFCRRHRIRRLSLFGSMLQGRAKPRSDVDLLVEFEPGCKPGLLAMARLEHELSELFDGREVELRTYEDLSPRFRDRVRDEARELYAAA